MMDVCLLGSGGVMPLRDRWLTSLLLRVNGKMALIDCGKVPELYLENAREIFPAAVTGRDLMMKTLTF